MTSPSILHSLHPSYKFPPTPRPPVFKLQRHAHPPSLPPSQTWNFPFCPSSSVIESKHIPTMKFLCSYGGNILLRITDGKLRYVGGHTRVLAVDPSISFSELMVKLVEFCGLSVTLRCPLPNGDLETLISITSDEDLANIIEIYDRASLSLAHPLKIRAILSPPKSLKKVSPPSSSSTSVNQSPTRSPQSSTESLPYSMAYRYVRPVAYPVGIHNGSGKACCYAGQFDGSPRFLYCGPRCNNFCH